MQLDTLALGQAGRQYVALLAGKSNSNLLLTPPAPEGPLLRPRHFNEEQMVLGCTDLSRTN